MDRDAKFQERVAQFTSEQKPLMLRTEGEFARYKVRGQKDVACRPPPS